MARDIDLHTQAEVDEFNISMVYLSKLRDAFVITPQAYAHTAVFTKTAANSSHNYYM